MIASPRQRSGIAAVLAGLVLLTGCADRTPEISPDGTATTPTVGQPTISSVTGNGDQSNRRRATQGGFTAEFAKCMRANGVPNFPDPNGEPGQLGPDSGVDPGSKAYRAAINGPCRSLAPPEWVDEGPGSAPQN
jgi:hypothetical protein